MELIKEKVVERERRKTKERERERERGERERERERTFCLSFPCKLVKALDKTGSEVS